MPQTIYRKDYRPYPFEVGHCQLSFEIFTQHVIVCSTLQFQRNPCCQMPTAGNCVLDGVGLEILSLELDGQKLEDEQDYRYTDNKLELFGSSGKDSFIFSARVQIDPYHNKSLEGMYQSGQILCSQNEATGFRHITFYPDRPDVLSCFVTEITADKGRYPRLLSNGNLLEKKDLGDGRHYVRWEDPFPKPAYLYAIVAGDLDLLDDYFITCSGRQVALEIYTDKGKTGKARFAMESLKQAMKWDEDCFGREYDLDLFMIVAVDSFNFGAMENKGLNIFNSSLVFASEESATDQTYENIASVIAHEYFHNWTGNRVTCRDWFQITLKEGLTVYRDELFSEDHFGREVLRIQQVNDLRNNQYPEDAGPNRHPIRPDSFIDINNFYSQTVYQKGAAVIRMHAAYLGKEGFRRGMDHYFAHFDGQAVSCDDFLDAIQEGGGKDLTLLRGWYGQAGTPHLYLNSEWDGEEFVLHLRQENPDAAVVGATRKDFPPLAFPFPLAIYGHPHGSPSLKKLQEDSPLISEEEVTLRYRLNSHSKPLPSLLLDHISPIEVHYNYSNEELLLLACYDQDAFNRYEALQKYVQGLILGSSESLKLPGAFVSLLRSCLQDGCNTSWTSAPTPRYLAYLLTPPSLQVLAASQVPPQFQALHQMREYYCRTLAQELESTMLGTYHALSQDSYERSSLAIGKRSLRHTLLSYLARLGKDEYHQLAYRQYQNSDNMTDMYSALLAISHWPGTHSAEVLQHFCERWKKDFLVLCRWFALQAGVPKAETLAKVQELEQHPLYQKENPNMLRSLYRVLAGNLAVFHDKNGAAYNFLAQRILQIDQFNSMMAADLGKCFVAYKFLDSESQQRMAKAVTHIANTPNISERLYEIVSKTLEQDE